MASRKSIDASRAALKVAKNCLKSALGETGDSESSSKKEGVPS